MNLCWPATVTVTLLTGGLSPGEEVGSTPVRLGVTHLLYQGAAENTQY